LTEKDVTVWKAHRCVWEVVNPAPAAKYSLGLGNASVDPLACALTPHLDRFDGETALASLAPRRKPIGHAIEELFGCLGS
jgi:hypothetical protein